MTTALSLPFTPVADPFGASDTSEVSSAWNVDLAGNPNALFGREAHRELSTVALPVQMGLAVLQGLRLEHRRVGPGLLCGTHKVIKIAVTSWPFRLDGVMTVRLGSLWCPQAWRQCDGQLQLLSPWRAERAELTDARELYEVVRRMRVPGQAPRAVGQVRPPFPRGG
ncbi:hypothetical protein [Streptomyces lushanensis]|uniref:hypothetical protein n=1 Tax=Streptomyces lushanensis TaxID=1434255 RepID=UPI00082F3DF2|nr:hypothetical protein [Streptomyces lushanensis]